MDLHSENVQTGLPRPDPDSGIEPATRENIDIDYEIMDVQGQLLDVAATLADRRGGAASSRDYLMCPVQLSSFTPEKRLSLFNSLVASPPFQIAETACSGFCFGLATTNGPHRSCSHKISRRGTALRAPLVESQHFQIATKLVTKGPRIPDRHKNSSPCISCLGPRR